MTALGRPNREQVVTSRASTATTLQALELTNGPTLASELKRASDEIAHKISKPTTSLQNSLLRFRPCSLGFRARLSKDLLGSPVKSDGVEDLLWTMLMLPEFQLIY
jgi:hypothetical protein